MLYNGGSGVGDGEVVASSYGSRATETRAENKDVVLWSIWNLRQKGQSVKRGGVMRTGRTL